MTVAIQWIVGIYIVIGLVVASLLGMIASGQGDPLTFLQFLKEVVIWPYRAWLTFGAR